ncbi:MAG TPA: DUF5916 domain-containing protein [Chryseolinea sp.]
MRHSTTILVLIFSIGALYAGEGDGKSRRLEKEAFRVEQSPVIDGSIEEEIWQQGGEKVRFVQFLPYNGKASDFETSVQIAYTDKAIYVAARMYDPAPEKILREFGKRDDSGRNADSFGFILDPYNGGMNAFTFFVTAAGVQSDHFISAGNHWDSHWDAVWNSAVKIDEFGWSVEFEIPYYAIRFPRQEVQHWGVNFYRGVKRNQEETYWNAVDNSKQGFVNQAGVLTGIKNIEPPLRLSFSPYVTSAFQHDGASGKQKFSLTGGMDLKYGINESFTVDVSLIPDFSQVQSDNVVLNLSAYEVRYAENRQFFTEGTELFDKGSLFYSRRVGSTFGSVDYDAEKEEVVNQPVSANLINAVKLSGRNKKGLGLGLFNAITNKTHATLRNLESGEEREVQVDPLTNFNVAVVDQNLKNNSSINFTNTNVTRADGGRDANVSGLAVSLNDKSLRYRVRAFGSYSAVNQKDDAGRFVTTPGYKYSVELGKVSGKWQYGASRMVETDKYQINDLGFLQAANHVSHSGYFRYNLLKPYWKLNRFNSTLSVYEAKMFKPDAFSGFNVSINTYAQFKNFWGIGMRYGANPVTGHDYFEPRTEGYYFNVAPSASYNVFIESDGRKSLKGNVYSGRATRNEWDQNSDWVGLFLRYRVNNKLSFNVEVNTEDTKGSRGYVTTQVEDNNALNEIVFGERDIRTATNIAGLNYTFNNRMGMNLRVRHYWSRVKYDGFYRLEQDGSLQETEYSGVTPDGAAEHDTNFNALNLDFVYFLQVAPGSFLNLVWKDAISSLTNEADLNYIQSYRQAADSPQINNVSLRFTYFIDYLTLKKTVGKI